ELDLVPNQVSVTVPTSISFGPNNLSVAHLVNTDVNGGGPYQEPPTGLRTADANGSIYVVYEFTHVAPDALETMEMPFTINYGPGAPATVLQLIARVGFAPLTSTVSKPTR